MCIPLAERLTVLDLLRRLSNDEPLRDFLSKRLADSPHTAYRWELPPITRETAGREAEFVLLPYGRLQREPDRGAFADRFTNEHDIVTFGNLRGDAELIMSCPRAADEVYVHLASFVRGAPVGRVDRLWQAVGNAMLQRLSPKPVWLSTAGMGVAWLHVRLDARPMYYEHEPYRNVG